ncbi:MAG: AMIN domain-containing protein, partial [Acidobacteria bacterium]|nr:AMIN domain-containing protein [Acidobacteriota bacterium]
MSRWRSFVVGLALVAHAAVLAAERPASVRLVEVTSESTESSQSVLITASAPASYTTRQPDPLTVLITLRDVAAGDVATRLRLGPDDPVTAVEVRDAVDDDGNPVTEVRIGLREPTVYEVRSRRQTIQVRFARRVASTPTPAPEDDAAPPPLVGRGRPATALLSVGVEVEPDAISVTLYGNGALSPGAIHETEDLPPRLVIDFPHLAAEAASLTPIEIDPVKQVRVAASTPELTTVVLDLVRPAVYHVEHLEGNDRVLRVVFPRDPALDPVAGIGGDPASETVTAWEVEAAIPELIAAEPPLRGEGSNTAVAAGGLDAERVARIEAMAERRDRGDALGAAPPASPTAEVALFNVTALVPLPQVPGPIALRVDGRPLQDPDLADVPRRPVSEGRELAQRDGTSAALEPAAVEASAIVVEPAAGVTPVALEPVGVPETPSGVDD